MSQTQENTGAATTTRPAQRKSAAPTTTNVTAETITEASTDSTDGNTLGFNTIEIASMDVRLPVKFGPGMTLTDSQAKILQAAFERQFTNNENALAKARTEGKNKTPQPTADELALKFADYEPNVGGTRIGSMEKVRMEAAWRMWSALMARHNAAVASGGAPVITKAGKNPVKPFVTIKDAEGKVVSSVADQRESFTRRLLERPEYADAIQIMVDTILTERGAAKAAAPAEDNAVSVDSLLD